MCSPLPDSPKMEGVLIFENPHTGNVERNGIKRKQNAELKDDDGNLDDGHVGDANSGIRPNETKTQASQSFASDKRSEQKRRW